MISLYFDLLVAQIKGQTSYKMSFVIEIIGYFVAYNINLIVIYFIFLKFPTIRGWTMAEIYYIAGLASISYSVAQTLAEGINRVPELIFNGEFDRFLVRPRSIIIQILPLSFRLFRISLLINGTIGICIAFSMLQLNLLHYRIIFFIISVISSTIVYFGIYLTGAAFCFWTIQGTELINAFSHGGYELNRYPITVYHKWMQKLFLYIIPIGFVSYYPNLAFLGKQDPLGGSIWFSFLSPIVAISFLFFTLLFWKLGLNRYQSTGS